MPEELVSGQSTPLELRYRQGDRPLPVGARFRVVLEPVSVRQLEYGPPSEHVEMAPYASPLPTIELEAGPIDGLGCRALTLAFPKGLEPGDGFALRIGNPSEDGTLVALVNAVPVTGLRPMIFADIEGDGTELPWVHLGWETLPKVTIHAGSAAALRITVPSSVGVGMPFSVRVAVTDAYDSRAYPAYVGSIALDAEGLEGLPADVQVGADDRCSVTVAGITASRPGVYRLVGTLEGRRFESNPMVVREDQAEPIFWGMLHGHDWYSECWGDGPANYYAFGRDIAGLDFLALSDHLGSVPTEHGYAGRLYEWRHGKGITYRDAWRDSVDTANAFHSPGAFVTLVGYEWSSECSGHYNVYTADGDYEASLALFSEGPVSQAFEMRRILEQTEALFFPHLHATYLPYNEVEEGRTRSGAPLTPVVEVYSDWGTGFPGAGVEEHTPTVGVFRGDLGQSYPAAVSQGIRIGAAGDSDTHTGWPARRFPAGVATEHHHGQGLTAIRTGDLSRTGVLDAYRARRTYATSGERIFVEARANGIGLGETLRTDDPVRLDVAVAGTAAIDRVTLFRGAAPFETRSPEGGVRDALLSFDLPEAEPHEVPYILEIVQTDDHRAWTSPIWVARRTVPNLTWEREADGTLYLVNLGHGPAGNVGLMHHATSYPVTPPPIAPVSIPAEEQEVGQVWTRRWDDDRIAVHFSWQGRPVSGKVRVQGFQQYEAQPNIRFSWFNTLEDHGGGVIEWRDGGRVPRSARPGRPTPERFDVTVRVKRTEPAVLHLEFDREIPVYVGDRAWTGATLSIPLNGLEGEGPTVVETLERLEPGERWRAPVSDGVWTADPLNAIAESREDDNRSAP